MITSSVTELPPLRRLDQLIILLSLAALVSLAWIYLVSMVHGMPVVSVAKMSGSAVIHPWTPLDFIAMFLMWAIMMVGMMVPSAVRMVLIYARVAQKAESRGQVIAPTYLFLGGYIAIWTLFSLAATLVQWALDQAALLSPMMVATSSALGAFLLVAAGFYQLSPLKDVCLRHCQSPMRFMSEHYRRGNLGAWRMGLEHGIYCLGCCWVLMGLLFLAGVMNLWWILLITLLVLLEKLLPAGIFPVKFCGAVMIAVGLIFLWVG